MKLLNWGADAGWNSEESYWINSIYSLNRQAKKYFEFSTKNDLQFGLQPFPTRYTSGATRSQAIKVESGALRLE